MQYQFTQSHDRLTVHIRGLFTFDDFEDFRQVIASIQAMEPNQVLIDLKETRMIDSAGIGMLFLADDKAKEAGKTLSLTGMTGMVEKVLNISKVKDLISVIPNSQSDPIQGSAAE